MLVETQTAQVYVAHGRRYFSKAAAYLALARRRAEKIAEHYGSADCRCRVCVWRLEQAEAGGDWRTPPPQLRRYAKKLAARDRAQAAGTAQEGGR